MSAHTKLEVGVAGADVVTAGEDALHHERDAHSIEQAEVLRDAVILKYE